MEQPENLESLSQHLGFAPQHIYYLVGESDNLYLNIKIPKRASPGKFRKISIPISELKGVQRVILQKVLSGQEAHAAAHAYVHGKSVVTAASKLCGPSKAVLKLDIKDFFPNISSNRVFGLFRSLGFNDKASFLLTKLTTYRGALCQGSPTSPYISNLICRNLDVQLTSFAEKWDLQYVRYSDDIFLVGHGNFDHKTVTVIAKSVISDNGFSLNHRKTRYSPKGKPRFHLGLATHGRRPQIPRQKRQMYRAAFFRASTNLAWAQKNLQTLQGMASWYKCVYGANDTYQNYVRILRNVQTLMLHETYSVN